jgi:rubrerythrin
MMIYHCPVCNSDKLMYNLDVEDARNNDSTDAHEVSIILKPEAIFKKRLFTSTLKAHICGECGYTMLFAERPQKLYEAYQERRARKTKQ